MRDHNIKAVYLTLNNKLEVAASEVSFDDIFNTTLPNDELCFNFESKFDAYQQYAYDDIRGIDLVVADTKDNQLRPLEIKLTVLPDSTTHKLDEKEWGTELVIRPATTTYCALGNEKLSKTGAVSLQRQRKQKGQYKEYLHRNGL